MVGVVAHGMQVLEIQGMVAGCVQGFGFMVPERGQSVVQAGNFKAQRRVNIHRHIQVRSDIQPVHLVDEFLGPAKSKSRDKNLAGVGQTTGQDLAETFGAVGAVAVETVAVGGFKDEEIARVRGIRVTQNGGVRAAEVA